MDDSQADIANWFSECNQPKLPKNGKIGTRTPSLAGESMKTSSSSISASKRSAFSNTVGVKIEDSGGISDHDEVNGEEVEEACHSPLKKKRTHARSDVSISYFAVLYFPSIERQQNIVTQVRPKNEDIPHECHEGNLWRASFIPTVYFWLSLQPDAWTLNDKTLRNALVMIGDCLYEDVDLGLDDDTIDPETQRPMFTKAAVFAVVRSRYLFYSDWI